MGGLIRNIDISIILVYNTRGPICPFTSIFLENTMEKMTSGEFRNYQYNEMKKVSFVMAIIITLLTVMSLTIMGSDEILRFLYVITPYKMTFVCFLFLTLSLALWLVYFAAKEQAENKLWLPDDTSQPIDYKTKGVMQ